MYGIYDRIQYNIIWSLLLCMYVHNFFLRTLPYQCAYFLRPFSLSCSSGIKENSSKFNSWKWVDWIDWNDCDGLLAQADLSEVGMFR